MGSDRRGYTLLELGIVLAVIFTFLTAVVATATGLTRAARAQRTGAEIHDMAAAAGQAVMRNLRVTWPAPAGPPQLDFNNGGAWVPLQANDPICFDLSRFPGTDHLCPTSGNPPVPGAAWSGGAARGYPAPLPVPPGSPLLALLGGTHIYSNGFNAWCQPYVACLYSYRAEVLTCVPQDDVRSAGLADLHSCGNCASWNGMPMECVLASAPTMSQRLDQLGLSYSPDAFSRGPLPNVYSDNSPTR